MALKFLHKDCRDSGEEETIIESVYHHPLVERRNENIPLWTIDLFVILRDLYDNHNQVVMYSTCVDGVAPHHHEIAWYRSHLVHEAPHINQLFKEAKANKWNIKREIISLSTLSEALTGHDNFFGAVVIMLVDCELLNDATFQTEGKEFIGHFIVLVEYAPSTDQFYALNPESSGELLKLSAGHLERARSHPGTDHDAILCFKTP